MSPDNCSSIKKYSFRIFITSVIGVVLNAVILYIGAMATGGGHGSFELWYLGLFISPIVWILVLAGFVSSVIIWKKSSERIWWTFPSLALLIVLTLLGLWGLKG